MQSDAHSPAYRPQSVVHCTTHGVDNVFFFPVLDFERTVRETAALAAGAFAS